MAIKDSRGPAVGDLFAGNYELLQEIGRGGFGVVFRAKKKGLAQELARKILIQGNDPAKAQEMRQRFEREALMISKLNNAHTIRQYGFSETDDGTMYFVMELLKGKNLDDVLEKEGPLNEQQVIHIAQGILQSVAEAHERNIIHRDMKPANIMLCEANGVNNFVKLLDFGIAKSTLGTHDITAVGQALGSPRYMAPEILRAQPARPVSDVYGIGLTLVECMTGLPVILDANVVAQARVQLAPEPLPIPHKVKQASFWPWLAASLEKDPARRYPTAGAMLQALNFFLHSPASFTPHRFISINTSDDSATSATMILNDSELRTTLDKYKQNMAQPTGARTAGFSSNVGAVAPIIESPTKPATGQLSRDGAFVAFNQQAPGPPSTSSTPQNQPLINDSTKPYFMIGAALIMTLVVLIVIKIAL